MGDDFYRKSNSRINAFSFCIYSIIVPCPKIGWKKHFLFHFIGFKAGKVRPNAPPPLKISKFKYFSQKRRKINTKIPKNAFSEKSIFSRSSDRYISFIRLIIANKQCLFLFFIGKFYKEKKIILILGVEKIQKYV